MLAWCRITQHHDLAAISRVPIDMNGIMQSVLHVNNNAVVATQKRVLDVMS